MTKTLFKKYCSKMIINQPTFIIAELSGEVVNLVKRFRSLYNPERISWPADITLAGSSGVGVLEYGQKLDDVIDLLKPVFVSFEDRMIEFEGIKNFPNTGVFYLSPKRDCFVTLHEKIISTDLVFQHSEFPYTPHCTLKDGKPDESDLSFRHLDYPKTAQIECFSIYQPYNGQGVRLYQFM